MKQCLGVFVVLAVFLLLPIIGSEPNPGCRYYFSSSFQKSANIQDDSLFCQASQDRIRFWEQQAKALDWFSDWNQALEWNCPYAKWFINGKLNACFNCVDRHVLNGLGNKVALFWEGEKGNSRSYSYNELLDEVSRFSNVLKDLGIRKGDRVAIYMPMIPEAIVSMLATARIGAVHTVIFGGIGAPSLKEKIEDATAKLVITADGGFRRGTIIEYKRTVDQIVADCPSVEHVIVVQHTDHDVPFNTKRDRWYREGILLAEPVCEPEIMDAEDLLFILYTSGTTGKAKGIIHTTGGYLVGVNATFRWVFDHKPTDVYWSTADIGWITGHSYVVYGPLSSGTTLVVYEGALDYPNQGKVWEIVEKYGVTILYTAPTAIRCFMKWGTEWPAKYDLTTLRLLGSIGEPLNPAAWHWYSQYIGNERCPIVDTWFQTETGAFVISPLPGVTRLKPGSITQALPGFDIAVLDEEGNESLEGCLAITSPYPSMLRGIFNDPERYQQTYWSKWKGEYYFAGDKAISDSDHYLWIGGRADEVLKVSGHRIGTAEVENALIQHPIVAESAVVGIDDALTGQAIVAFVVLKQGMMPYPILNKEVADQVTTCLGGYARPKEVILVDELPKTRSGKILRRLLRDLVESRSLGDITSLEDPTVLERLKAQIETNRARPGLLSQGQIAAIFDTVVERPRFADPPFTVLLGGTQIATAITPILQERIGKTKYDRVFFANQFINHYLKEKERDPLLTPVESLLTFDVDTSVATSGGSHCIGLTNDILTHLPGGIYGYFVASQLPTPFQQLDAPVYCHAAALIRFQNPVEPRDCGYVLLDPSFDLAIPIIIQEGKPFSVDLREKGLWTFTLEGDQIKCVAGPRPDGLPWDEERYTGSVMFYRTDHYLNPVQATVIPFLFVDRRLSLLSRRPDGTHLAHINIGLNWKQITWSVDDQRGKPIPFERITSGSFRFDSDFAQRLSLSEQELNERVRQVIDHLDILDAVYYQFLDYLGKQRITSDSSPELKAA